jgi:hypothetical protein
MDFHYTKLNTKQMAGATAGLDFRKGSGFSKRFSAGPAAGATEARAALLSYPDTLPAGGGSRREHMSRSLAGRNRLPPLIREMRRLGSEWLWPLHAGQAAPEEEENGRPAAQRSERRCREILDRRVPSGRKMLEVFQDAGVDPKAADDSHAAPA